jgi:predicted GTPase
MSDYLEITNLINKLDKCQFVINLNSADEKEAVRLAHAIFDIKKSINIISNKLEKLNDIHDSDILENILFDIREELRHIIYHVKDSHFFNCLIE